MSKMIIADYDRYEEPPVSLGKYVVTIDYQDNIHFQSSEIEVKYQLEELTGDGTGYNFALDSIANVCYAVGECSYHIWRLELLKNKSYKIKLARTEIDDSDFFRQMFVRTKIGVLFIYESGLFLLSDRGVVWNKYHKRIDWFFKETQEDKIIYESEHEGVWAYSLFDGTLVTPS